MLLDTVATPISILLTLTISPPVFPHRMLFLMTGLPALAIAPPWPDAELLLSVTLVKIGLLFVSRLTIPPPSLRAELLLKVTFCRVGLLLIWLTIPPP